MLSLLMLALEEILLADLRNDSRSSSVIGDSVSSWILDLSLCDFGVRRDGEMETDVRVPWPLFSALVHFDRASISLPEQGSFNGIQDAWEQVLLLVTVTADAFVERGDVGLWDSFSSWILQSKGVEEEEVNLPSVSADTLLTLSISAPILLSCSESVDGLRSESMEGVESNWWDVW